MSSDEVGFAVVGADHLHLFSLADALVKSGARPVAHTADGQYAEAYGVWQTGSAVRTREEILADPAVSLVVTVGPHDRRAADAIEAIEHGRQVLSAKPGVTNRVDLDRIRAAVADRPGRPWTVLFTERFENRAIASALRLAASGTIGRVVAVHGAGPHALVAESRPDWFWDRQRTGGIIVDIGCHQIDQFVALCGDPSAPSHGVSVAASRVGNVASPEHPDMEDIGAFTLVGGYAVGEHRVDYLSPAGLPTWGDVRLTVVGTEGTIEVRANIDVAGQPGGEHLIVTDGQGVRRVDVADETQRWADQLLADVADAGERLMSQGHVFTVSDLALQAQERASAWGEP